MYQPNSIPTSHHPDQRRRRLRKARRAFAMRPQAPPRYCNTFIIVQWVKACSRAPYHEGGFKGTSTGALHSTTRPAARVAATSTSRWLDEPRHARSNE